MPQGGKPRAVGLPLGREIFRKSPVKGGKPVQHRRCRLFQARPGLEQTAAAVLDRFAAFYRGFPENLPAQREAYCARLATLGQTVEIVGEQGLYTAVGVDGRFGLIVERDGQRRTLSSGEVSVRARKECAAK